MPRGPRHWLLLLAAVLLAVVALIGGIWLGSGESPASLLDRMRGSDTPSARSPQTDPPQTDNNPVVIKSATEIPTPTAESEAPASDGPDPNAPAVDPMPPRPPSLRSSRPAKMTSSPNPRQMWCGPSPSAGPMATTTACTTCSAPMPARRPAGRISSTAMKGSRAEAGITNVAISMNGDSGSNPQVPVHVKLTSSYIGDIEQDNTIQPAQEDDRWLIEWTPSLIFTGFG